MTTSHSCAVGQVFVDLPAAKRAIAAYVIDNGESSLTKSSDQRCFYTSSPVKAMPIASLVFEQPLRHQSQRPYDINSYNAATYLHPSYPL